MAVLGYVPLVFTRKNFNFITNDVRKTEATICKVLLSVTKKGNIFIKILELKIKRYNFNSRSEPKYSNITIKAGKQRC